MVSGFSSGSSSKESKLRAIAIAAAIVLVVVVGYVVLFSGTSSSQKREDETKTYVTAKQDIPAFTLVTADMVTTTTVKPQGYLNGASTSVDDVVGSMTKSSVGTGHIMYSDQLLKESNPNAPGGLSATLDNGMRAMGMSVDVVSGVSGALAVGNRVDVVCVSGASGSGNTGGANRSGEASATTVLQNIRILAVLQPSNGSASDTGSTTLTLEVSPEDAEKLALAVNSGKTYLTLRGQTDAQQSVVATIHASEILD